MKKRRMLESTELDFACDTEWNDTSLNLALRAYDDTGVGSRIVDRRGPNGWPLVVFVGDASELLEALLRYTGDDPAEALYLLSLSLMEGT